MSTAPVSSTAPSYETYISTAEKECLEKCDELSLDMQIAYRNCIVHLVQDMRAQVKSLKDQGKSFKEIEGYVKERCVKIHSIATNVLAHREECLRDNASVKRELGAEAESLKSCLVLFDPVSTKPRVQDLPADMALIRKMVEIGCAEERAKITRALQKGANSVEIRKRTERFANEMKTTMAAIKDTADKTLLVSDAALLRKIEALRNKHLAPVPCDRVITIAEKESFESGRSSGLLTHDQLLRLAKAGELAGGEVRAMGTRALEEGATPLEVCRMLPGAAFRHVTLTSGFMVRNADKALGPDSAAFAAKHDLPDVSGPITGKLPEAPTKLGKVWDEVVLAVQHVVAAEVSGAGSML